MAVIDWPAGLVPSKVTWGLQSNTESFTSPLNRAIQTVERPGAKWTATWEFPPMNSADSGLLAAFLASLGGQAGRFTVWPHHRPGMAGFSPLVNGAVSNFKFLPTKSWPPNTLVMRAGDFLSVGGELKMVTADVTSDAGGAIIIPIVPPLRVAPAPNAPITVNKPRTTMLLSADKYEIAVTPGRIAEQVVIGGVESF